MYFEIDILLLLFKQIDDIKKMQFSSHLRRQKIFGRRNGTGWRFLSVESENVVLCKKRRPTFTNPDRRQSSSAMVIFSRYFIKFAKLKPVSLIIARGNSAFVIT